MFGLEKFTEAKKKAEELKAKLAAMDFEGKSYNDKVSIKCSGDKRFHSLEIDDSIFKIRTKEEVQTLHNNRSGEYAKGKAEGDPFIVRGGYRCRHTWLPVVEI
jgi:hypothetical protein